MTRTWMKELLGGVAALAIVVMLIAAVGFLDDNASTVPTPSAEAAR